MCDSLVIDTSLRGPFSKYPSLVGVFVSGFRLNAVKALPFLSMREFAIEVPRALLMWISGSLRFVANRAWIQQVTVSSESSDQCLTLCSEKAK